MYINKYLCISIYLPIKAKLLVTMQQHIKRQNPVSYMDIYAKNKYISIPLYLFEKLAISIVIEQVTCNK